MKLFGREKKVTRTRLVFKSTVVEGVLAYSKSFHPQEGILLLKGKISKGEIIVTGLGIPPLSEHAEDAVSFPMFMLPLDTAFIGIAHSHPSGELRPSVEDLQNAFGGIMAIAAFPYESLKDLGVFDREGNRIPFEVVS
ncbi:MAG: Mov34/MPN/PAD-1 family protein [Thaumarchaeota archaeon]|nr:Mov34/MPN/PAD-1 family protein [Nitrososphaerota archaeon]